MWLVFIEIFLLVCGGGCMFVGNIGWFVELFGGVLWLLVGVCVLCFLWFELFFDCECVWWFWGFCCWMGWGGGWLVFMGYEFLWCVLLL